GRLRKLPPWGDELRRRLDPKNDGWPSEALAPLLEEKLARAIEGALRAGDSALVQALATDFVGATDLRPAQIETAFDDGAVAISRAHAAGPIDAVAQGAPTGRERLVAQLAALRAPFISMAAGASM